MCVCWWEVLHSLLLHRGPYSLFSASRQEVWQHGAWYAMLMQQKFWQCCGMPAVLQDGSQQLLRASAGLSRKVCVAAAPRPGGL